MAIVQELAQVRYTLANIKGSIMKAIVVYESLWSNTSASARAIAGGAWGREGRGKLLSRRPRYGGGHGSRGARGLHR